MTMKRIGQAAAILATATGLVLGTQSAALAADKSGGITGGMFTYTDSTDSLVVRDTRRDDAWAEVIVFNKKWPGGALTCKVSGAGKSKRCSLVDTGTLENEKITLWLRVLNTKGKFSGKEYTTTA